MVIVNAVQKECPNLVHNLIEAEPILSLIGSVWPIEVLTRLSKQKSFVPVENKTDREKERVR